MALLRQLPRFGAFVTASALNYFIDASRVITGRRMMAALSAAFINFGAIWLFMSMPASRPVLLIW